MEVDKNSLTELGIFDSSEDKSVFSLLNFSITTQGKEKLKNFLSRPLSSVLEISNFQLSVKIFSQVKWMQNIQNGTLLVASQFFESNISPISSYPGKFETFNYKTFNKPDYNLIKYSVQHILIFLKDLNGFVQQLPNDLVEPLKSTVKSINDDLQQQDIQNILSFASSNELSDKQLLHFAHALKHRLKNIIRRLIDSYSVLDALHSIAVANEKLHLSFPQFVNTEFPYIKAKGLFHPLIEEPVSYDIELNKDKNFMFLTSANMAGKSTFIKATGVAVYLAHCGFGVPATTLSLCYFEGLQSNINITDSVSRGESYFYTEVQRIATTVKKINNGKRWLILIDELFKGTNVQDAMKCSLTVIEGLVKIKTSAFILSTHLYEISEDLKKFTNIQFKYFQTEVKDDMPVFSYKLLDGISNDRLGFLILKQSGVVKILSDLK
ncbi:MAG: DNA mismatch repair protein MutS [Bacteroidetes bacterium]|nr:DNA mismatch repair protein MutS [Bacteroidota bacterium]